MPFTQFSSMGDVAQAYQVAIARENFVEPSPMPVSDYLRSELDFVRDTVAFTSSEASVCENLIYPILKEVWKAYTDVLSLWSHIPLTYDDTLSGTPDYILARKSVFGHLVFDQPHLLVVEAKRDDFERGWGQCLAAMVAAQKLNNLPQQVLYGVVASGRTWDFGKLENSRFLLDSRSIPWGEIDRLVAALNSLFLQCRRQVEGLRVPA